MSRRNAMLAPHTPGIPVLPVSLVTVSCDMMARRACSGMEVSSHLGRGAPHFGRMRPPTTSALQRCILSSIMATQSGAGKTSSSVKAMMLPLARSMPALRAGLMPWRGSKTWWRATGKAAVAAFTTACVSSDELLFTTMSSHVGQPGTVCARRASSVCCSEWARLYVGMTTLTFMVFLLLLRALHRSFDRDDAASRGCRLFARHAPHHNIPSYVFHNPILLDNRPIHGKVCLEGLVLAP